MNDFTATAGVIDRLRGVPVTQGEALTVAITRTAPDADGNGHGDLITSTVGAAVRFEKATRASEGWSLLYAEPIYFQIPKGEDRNWFVVASDDAGPRYFGALNPASGGCIAEGTVRINTEALTLLRRRPI